ncbi:ABC transporter ATP-binding protein [Vibrio sp. ZSDE26]|uniref:ABC transporter ATP-binding protein n=1 Tax=Vibrio amylolyticus TaxID=2847292 RepID=A0A9X1XPY1_9VIBR|nr:ABC transporter ATP-binding protein [Vibrio amylolyticus]MCK6263394.1 ABC transporter ATP-binding protein [Vibrio amylolyticus]
MGIVNINKLDISYESTKVVDQLDLHIDNGEFLVLLGPSGCGKSTLLNAIGGLIDTSGGSISFDGKDVTWTDPKDRGIGMVFQSYALYPTMSVEKNMSFGLRIAGVDKAIIEKKVQWAAKLLQLEPLLDRKPAALSGGQRQRVAIGRALVRDADIYLFDEPLSNLDAKLRAELRLEIKKLHNTLNSTMIYVTHDQIEALTLADRIAVMKDGIIQQLDTPHNVYNKPSNLFVATFLGSPAMNCVEGELEVKTDSVHFHAGKLSVDVTNYGFTQTIKTGQKITLGVRPEHIEMTSVKDESLNQFSGCIELVEPMGSDSLLWSKLDTGHQLSHRTNSDETTVAGDNVSITIDATKCSLFDSITTERL